MKPLGKPRDHYWLTLGMSDVAEVDLSEVLAEGRMTRQEYADLVTSCRACPSAQRCREWLDQLSDAPRAVPSWCINRALWAELQCEND